MIDRTGRMAMLLAAVLGTLAAGRSAPPVPDPSAAGARKAAQPIEVHALPNLKSMVLFVIKRGDPLLVAEADVRVAALAPRSVRSACCGEGYYDPDQQTDVVDRLGEGYVAAAQERAVAARAAAAPAGPTLGAGSRDAGLAEPLALLEPGGLGRWVMVSSPDGRQRGWALLKDQPAVSAAH